RPTPALDRRRDDPDRDRDRRDDDDFDDDRPRRKKGKKGKRSVWPWLVFGGGGLLVAAAAGLLIWYLMSGAGGDDLAYVPEDASAVMSVRVADLWKADKVQELLRLTGAPDLAAKMREETGLEPKDVERITWVAPDGSPQENWWAVILTTKSLDQD